MVQHSVEAHGGTRPFYLGLIHSIEPRPMYRAVREAVMIGMMPGGVGNINRCQEWGNPRVPVLTASGGDHEGPLTDVLNPRPSWSKDMMEKIKQGKLKRLQYLDEDSDRSCGPNGAEGAKVVCPAPANANPRPTKTPRMDPDPDPGLTPQAGPGGRVAWTLEDQGGEVPRPGTASNGTSTVPDNQPSPPTPAIGSPQGLSRGREARVGPGKPT